MARATQRTERAAPGATMGESSVDLRGLSEALEDRPDANPMEHLRSMFPDMDETKLAETLRARQGRMYAGALGQAYACVC